MKSRTNSTKLNITTNLDFIDTLEMRWKRPLDTPKRIIERRERGEKER